ncbi:DUF4293 family protein [Cruoricaptor ignavus]|uniref:DUF4293 family protein n=1 Tax=Cruoricaptor ignavus TaxID=1118202 RepID=A0A7M1SZZ2_9FLAO|nr:DUF4293 family protein [Cruoricaptor ignavus]QOR73129.1 DUF4293 family protein [Cruoricaptor ignavus]
MLQRIQTVWMALALLCGFSLIFVKDDLGPQLLDGAFYFLMAVFTALTVFSIYSFKNRKLQVLLNRIGIVLNALLLALLSYWLLSLPGGMEFPEKGIEPLFPLLAMVCLAIANTFIRRDERLVKSVDRLR